MCIPFRTCGRTNVSGVILYCRTPAAPFPPIAASLTRLGRPFQGDCLALSRTNVREGSFVCLRSQHIRRDQRKSSFSCTLSYYVLLLLKTSPSCKSHVACCVVFSRAGWTYGSPRIMACGRRSALTDPPSVVVSEPEPLGGSHGDVPSTLTHPLGPT
ncbi:hypothetical protein OH77DRAFT_1022543 [Trametes cingulata]|nr:hypothetical protein OH77DRAFT_1022543 [Trametes cingulata]